MKPLALLETMGRQAQAVRHPADLDRIIDTFGDRQVVMLGESSHGTHEFYTWRAYITQQLVLRKGFRFVAVEGDWPPCYALNRFIREPSGQHPQEVLEAFARWPAWMWANWEVAALAGSLARINRERSGEEAVGFYGLDVYSLWESLQIIRGYLGERGDASLEKAEAAFRCFEPYVGEDETAYAEAAALVPQLCTAEVEALLVRMKNRSPLPGEAPEDQLHLVQQAHTVSEAERYYRAMLGGGPQAWNIRDDHMQDTLERLLQFYGPGTRCVVWAHNTHIGDARATDMQREGMHNLGELARRRLGEDAVALIGFGTYEGSVIAGRSWGAPLQVMNLPPARPGSWEDLLHRAYGSDQLLLFETAQKETMNDPLPHRAVGVVYRPEWDGLRNYVPSALPFRYDAFLYRETSTALHPLHGEAGPTTAPQTFPFGV